MELSGHHRTQALSQHCGRQAKFRTWAETTDAIFVIQGSLSSQVCYVNPAAEAITGYKTEELLAHSIFANSSSSKSVGRYVSRVDHLSNIRKSRY